MFPESNVNVVTKLLLTGLPMSGLVASFPPSSRVSTRIRGPVARPGCHLEDAPERGLFASDRQ
jgi:hypothetical protein